MGLWGRSERAAAETHFLIFLCSVSSPPSHSGATMRIKRIGFRLNHAVKASEYRVCKGLSSSVAKKKPPTPFENWAFFINTSPLDSEWKKRKVGTVHHQHFPLIENTMAMAVCHLCAESQYSLALPERKCTEGQQMEISEPLFSKGPVIPTIQSPPWHFQLMTPTEGFGFFMVVLHAPN